MKTLRYISVQPAIEYYTWQVEVMINNFIKNGVNPNQIDIICSFESTVPEKWLELQNHYNTVRFFFYKDTRRNPVYISSIRPHVLKKHFRAHPELEQEAILYHDCDIVLTKPVDWSEFLLDDVWYLSDTNSYINSDYIRSKRYGIYERMCEIVDISEKTPIRYNEHSGGAQYLMKNINSSYWDKVEKDSEKLYQFFLDHLKAFPESPRYHPIQKWTADMWAVLWNAWYFGHDTRVVKEMDFCWPMDPISKWDTHHFFHNAGVSEETGRSQKMFYKGQYVDGNLPYKDLQLENFDETKCTYNYVKEILETSQKSCL